MQFIDFQRTVLTKLETIIQKQEDGLSMLRMLLGATKVDGNDILEDVLPQPLDTAEALKELNTRLEDDQYRRKMVIICMYLILLYKNKHLRVVLLVYSISRKNSLK